MKLDRNINPNGRGKYALINWRRMTVETGDGTPEHDFFVVKLKDRFAESALLGYAGAIKTYIAELRKRKLTVPSQKRLMQEHIAGLREWEREIRKLAKDARGIKHKKTPD